MNLKAILYLRISQVLQLILLICLFLPSSLYADHEQKRLDAIKSGKSIAKQGFGKKFYKSCISGGWSQEIRNVTNRFITTSKEKQEVEQYIDEHCSCTLHYLNYTDGGLNSLNEESKQSLLMNVTLTVAEANRRKKLIQSGYITPTLTDDLMAQKHWDATRKCKKAKYRGRKR